MATVTIQDVNSLLNETKARSQTRVREHFNDDIHDPWDVFTVNQLITVMSAHPQKCFDMLKILRTERDLFRGMAEGYILLYQTAERYRSERDLTRKLVDQSKSGPKPENKPPMLPELVRTSTPPGTAPSHKSDKSSKLPDPELFMGTERPSWEV